MWEPSDNPVKFLSRYFDVWFAYNALISAAVKERLKIITSSNVTLEWKPFQYADLPSSNPFPPEISLTFVLCVSELSRTPSTYKETSVPLLIATIWYQVFSVFPGVFDLMVP